jgi:eukaryotic-like serine/threonine-protein kinase
MGVLEGGEEGWSEDEVTNQGKCSWLKGSAEGEISMDGVDPNLGVPRVMGRLEITDKIGEGGMSAVYRAMHQDLEVERAVKILLPPVRTNDRSSAPSRFPQPRVRFPPSIRHPNLVQIYNIGEEKGFTFIEMELVHGNTLTEMLDNVKMEMGMAKLPLPVALAIVIDIAEGLDAAHTAQFPFQGKVIEGVTHRDIKPANIMVTDSGRSKLLNLGIARPPESDFMPGQVLPPLPYISPEQWEGRMDIDWRTDLFSLGVVLYEITTGEQPFQKAFQRGIVTGAEAVISDTYRPPGEIASEIDFETGQIIRKALKPEREKRYQSAREMLDDLREVLKESQVSDTHQLVRRYRRGETFVPSSMPEQPLGHSGKVAERLRNAGKAIWDRLIR